MLTAVFITCIAALGGEQNCGVTYTDMTELARNKSECVQAARKMQDTVASNIESEMPEFHYTRKDVMCGSRVEMLKLVIKEYKAIYATGTTVTASEF